ncbi:MAG TPA: His/Gly/Thr/Pro-type tRNA ligase C-terminal domain-containing protein [Candidatus Paceibacterota bacterium]
MIRLKDTHHSNTADFLSAAIHIAEYYGFVPLDEMRVQRQSESERRGNVPKKESEILYARRDERTLASAARKCAACARSYPEGFLTWRTIAGSTGTPATTLELHVVGTASAIAEALLLVVAGAIAEEAGITERALSINNIGSFESSNRFVRDVGTYLRKHIESISPTLRPRAALDPLGTLVQLIEKGHPATPRAPQPMEYLTEDERRKFWELLEYLEVYGLAYELSPQVLGSRDCWAHSLYELSTLDRETGARITFATGGRYDPLATRFAQKHTPAVMIAIHCETRGRAVPKRETRGLPAIYYAHLGPEARRRSLAVLEILRHAEIPVHQSLLYERIGEQMLKAKELAVPYVLIMGHKEAMENTVLVREVATNSQEAVPVGDLPNYLRRRRMGTWKSLAAI